MNPLAAILLALTLAHAGQALDNGLARTPPMGWLAWERFRCNTDCQNDPMNCISEELFMDMADEMAKQGFLEAGYEYIIIDDCWSDKSGRDPKTGELRPDPDRFPSGIPALVDYVNKRGLKLGIYGDYGTLTCGGYPGTLGHLEKDANTFAKWGIDYVKLDGCYVDTALMPVGYPKFGEALNATGRPIVYSCSWPAYIGIHNEYYASIAEHCNLWRNAGDIQDSWTSVTSIMNVYADNQDLIAPFAGPGHWNDPDMLIIGNFGLSLDQARSQMAIWAIYAAPLIMSVDLRTIRPEFKEILLNPHVIKIDQDPLGIQGKRVYTSKQHVDIFVKPINPVSSNGYHSAAVAVLYRGDGGTPVKVNFKPGALGLNYTGGYVMTEVFENKVIQETVKPDDTVTASVNPSGVQLYRFDIKQSPMKSSIPIEVNLNGMAIDIGFFEEADQEYLGNQEYPEPEVVLVPGKTRQP